LTIAVKLALVLAAVIVVLVLCRIFSSELRLLFKTLLNTAVGFAALFLYNWLGAFVGLGIGINPLNAITIGLLGAPGLALILFIRWLLIT